MQSKYLRIAALGAAATLALGAVACGSDDDEAAVGPPAAVVGTTSRSA